MVNIKVERAVRDAWKEAAGGMGVSAWLRQLAEVELASSSVMTPVVHPVNPPAPVLPLAVDTTQTAGKLPAHWRPQPKPKVTFDDLRVIPGVKIAAEIAEEHRLRRERGLFDAKCLLLASHRAGVVCRMCGGSR